MDQKLCKDILSYCQNMIRETLQQDCSVDNRNKITLLNEIMQVTANEKLVDQVDPRRSLKYVRNLIAALCDFHLQGQFYIPNSWISIGEFVMISKLFNFHFFS